MRLPFLFSLAVLLALSGPLLSHAGAASVTVKPGDTLYGVAHAHGLSVAQLRDLNGLKSDVLRPGQVLQVAGRTAAAPKSAPKPAPKAAPKPVSATSYTVKSGDSLGKIARQHHTTAAHLQALNGLKDSQIRVGQVIRLTGNVPAIKPAPKSKPKPAPKAAPKPVSATSYTVKSGDSLGKIARQHHTTAAHLQALNGLKDSQIRVGQVIRLTGSVPAIKPAPKPASKPAPKAAPKPVSATSYTVKSGDSLGKIARQMGVSVAAIQQANGLSSSVIGVGQRLRIPARGTRAAAVSSVPAGMERRTVYGYQRVGLRDTPASFAARFGLSAEQVRRLNGLGSTRQITVGSRLLVPQRVMVPVPPRPHAAAVTRRTVSVQGVSVEVVQVDLRHPDVLVTPVLPGGSESFSRGASVRALTASSGARALINGSYFHPQTYAPAGDIVMQGRLLTWGRIPAALAITPDNRASIRGSTTALFGRPLESSWQGMETVIASGPRLLAGGAVQGSYSQVFQDPAVFGQAARSAIGLSSSRDLLLVSTHAQLSVGQMARVMQALGARDALLLDGGSSAGLSYGGQVVLDSVRRVSYGIGVFSGYVGRRYIR